MASDSVFRCRKCRCVLFSDENVVTEHGFQMYGNSHSNELESHSEEELVCSMADLKRQTQWYINIDDENTPPWIQQSVERENWLKGKLNCPKCRGRVGSFDFISVSRCPCGKYSKPAVHALCGRVDHSSKSITKDLPLLPVASAVPRSRTSLGSDRVQRQTSSENILTTSDDHSDSSVPGGNHGNRTLASPMADDVLRELPSSLSAFGVNLDDLNNNDHGIGYHDNKEFHGNNRTAFNPQEENAVRNQNPSLFCAENGHYEDEFQRLNSENFLPNSENVLDSNSPEYDCERIRSQGDSSGRSCLPLSGARSRNNQSVHSSSPYEDMVDVLNIVEAMTSGASRQTGSESRKRSKLKRRKHRQRSEGQEVEGEQERQISDNRFSLLVKEPNTSSSTEDGLQRGDNFSVTEETPVSDDHLCPVCLDLYYEPHLCNPCGHVFCEPCLRKLARAKPIKTICPLCREIIIDCHKNKDLKDTLMESYSQRYKDRHRTERKFCSDNFYALPRAWLYRYVPDNTHNSRKTWMTVLMVVLGIFIFFPPALGNVLTLLDALFTVLSIYDLVTII